MKVIGPMMRGRISPTKKPARPISGVRDNPVIMLISDAMYAFFLAFETFSLYLLLSLYEMGFLHSLLIAFEQLG